MIQLVLVLVVLALGASDAMAACYIQPPCGCKDGGCGGVFSTWCYVASTCRGASWDPIYGYTMGCTQVACPTAKPTAKPISCRCTTAGGCNEQSYVSNQMVCGLACPGNTCEYSASCPYYACQNYVAPTPAPVPTRVPTTKGPTTSQPTYQWPAPAPLTSSDSQSTVAESNTNVCLGGDNCACLIGRVGNLCVLTVVGILLIIGLVVGVCVCACLGCCCFAACKNSTTSWPQRQPAQAAVALAVEAAQNHEKA